MQKNKINRCELEIHNKVRTNKYGSVNLVSKKGVIEKNRDICGGSCGFNSN